MKTALHPLARPPQFARTDFDRSIAAGAANPLRSRWHFFAICCYVASQIYLLPIAARGPSWAVWPKVADLVVAVMIAVAPFFLLGKQQASPASREVFSRMLLAFAGCALSFFLVNLLLGRAGQGLALSDGVYYLYRLLQVVTVYWYAATIVYTPARIRLLRRLVSVVFVATSGLCVLTFVDIVKGPSLVAHLPSGRIAGAWAPYFINQARGLGAVGYNHAYVAAQILLLLALKMVLDDRPRSLVNSAFLLLGIVAAFASGSRAGLAAILLYAFCLFVRNPRYIPLVAVLLFLASMFVPGEMLKNHDLAGMAEAQGEIADPMQAEQFRARIALWQAWFDWFCREPDLLITGIGFGGTRGDQAIGAATHSMPAMVLVECGVMGLLVYLWLVFVALDTLRRVESPPQPLLWGSICLLFGALTQETFYPVAAMGHFLVFYMGALAIALQLPAWHRNGRASSPSPTQQVLPGQSLQSPGWNGSAGRS